MKEVENSVSDEAGAACWSSCDPAMRERCKVIGDASAQPAAAGEGQLTFTP